MAIHESCSVDATAIVNSGAYLKIYSATALNQCTDSLGDVTVRPERNVIMMNGVGADTDTFTASAKAYLTLNSLVFLIGPIRSVITYDH